MNRLSCTLSPIRSTLNARGSLLIVGLWAMSIFSVMTTSLAFNASQHVVMMKREIEELQNKTDFVSGLNQAAQLIAVDPYPHEDSPADSWYGTLLLQKPFAGRMEVQVEDEESKLNLNEAPEAMLTAFFKNFEDEVSALKGSRKDYVKEITKLRATKRIDSLEELLLMDGFEKEDFPVLRPFLTVYPDSPLINLNTANPLILKSLLDFLSGDHGIKAIFTGRLEEHQTLAHQGTGAPVPRTGDRVAGGWWTEADLRPEIFAEKLKLPKTPFMMSLVQEFLAAVTTDSETFHIDMKLSNGRQASGIFRYRAGQMRAEVLGWHEE